MKLRNVAEEDGCFGGVHHRVFTGTDIDLEDRAVAWSANGEQVEADAGVGETGAGEVEIRERALQLAVGRLPGEEVALGFVFAGDIFFAEADAAVELVLAVCNDSLSGGDLRLEDGDLRLLDFHLREGVTVIHRKKHIALGNFVTHFHHNLTDQAGCGRRDADIFIHALNETASTDGVRIGRLRRWNEWLGRRSALAKTQNEERHGNDPADREIEGKAFRHAGVGYGRRSGRSHVHRPSGRCGRQMDKSGCRG